MCLVQSDMLQLERKASGGVHGEEAEIILTTRVWRGSWLRVSL
jgi:hypothetical protein